VHRVSSYPYKNTPLAMAIYLPYKKSFGIFVQAEDPFKAIALVPSFREYMTLCANINICSALTGIRTSRVGMGQEAARKQVTQSRDK
jgi:hypothetical protein